ncbi:hypothetical protein, partial [Acidithiobacillus sp.]|uniref:hypothetical protein n=1 Tax=Acidithiobacillus sp. TaxID=1872118 RepID=UPI003CFE8E06
MIVPDDAPLSQSGGLLGGLGAAGGWRLNYVGQLKEEMVKKYKTSKVFVPGGMPRLTYVPREAIKLEASLRNAVENLHKLITVTGQTKSGKTVLVNTVLPRAGVGQNIWIDG